MQWRIINWGYGSKETGKFRFDDEGCQYTLNGTVTKDTTGITGIEADSGTPDGAIYDLAGRRVTNPGSGFYIINGRKTLLP